MPGIDAYDIAITPRLQNVHAELRPYSISFLNKLGRPFQMAQNKNTANNTGRLGHECYPVCEIEVSCTRYACVLASGDVQMLLCRFEDGLNLDAALGIMMDAWKDMKDGDSAKELARCKWLGLVKETIKQALKVPHPAPACLQA